MEKYTVKWHYNGFDYVFIAQKRIMQKNGRNKKSMPKKLQKKYQNRLKKTT